MKYIVGIDYGSKFCGLARADASSPVKIATPWKLLERSELESFILQNKNEIDSIVLGKSLDLSGEENPVNKDIVHLKAVLEKEGFKVFLQDERFSSQAVLAEKRYQKHKTKSRKPGKKERLDAQAATVILQSFLDSYF